MHRVKPVIHVEQHYIEKPRSCRCFARLQWYNYKIALLFITPMVRCHLDPRVCVCVRTRIDSFLSILESHNNSLCSCNSDLSNVVQTHTHKKNVAESWWRSAHVILLSLFTSKPLKLSVARVASAPLSHFLSAWQVSWQWFVRAWTHSYVERWSLIVSSPDWGLQIKF